MKNIIFISTHNASRGKGASVRVHSKECAIKRGILHKYLQYSEVDNEKYSNAIEQMSLDEFREIFTDDDVKIMTNNGLLNYYPNGIIKYGKYLYDGKNDKYPIFRKEVYLAYGVAFDEYGSKK